MLLPKEANTEDVQLKSQLTMSISQDEDTTKGSEFIWPQYGFFGEQNVDVIIPKANFPELTLCYINQARVSLVKSGIYCDTIYCDYVVLAQIMPMTVLDPSVDLKTYVPNDNETIIDMPSYDINNGLFQGLTRKLGLITVRGDEQERFFSYGYSMNKVLYCHMKTKLPNIFSSICFKKHTQLLLDQHDNGVNQSRQFFFLPVTLDRNENLIQLSGVHLHPIEIDYEKFKTEFNIDSFNPALLDRREEPERNFLRSAILKLMRKAATLSNQNLKNLNI